MIHNRQTHPALAYGITVGERFSESMSSLLVPLWALALHAPAPVIGLDVAAQAIAPMALSIPIGAAADRLGSRRIIALGSLIAFIATALCALIPNYWLLGLWQTFAGLGRSAAWIGAQALITNSATGSQRYARVGWLSLSAQIGNFLGPALAGLLLARLGAPVAFLTAAAVIGAVAVLVVAWPGSDPPAKEAKPRQNSVGGDFARAFGLMASRDIQVMSAATVVRLAIIALRVSFYVVFLHQWHFGSVTIGILISLCSFASAVAAGLAGVANRFLSYRAMLYSGLLVMMAAIALAPVWPIFPYQAGAMVFFGLGNGVSQPALITLLAEASSESQRGLALGLRSTLNRIAWVGSPMLLGGLAAWMPLSALLVLFSGACALGLGVVSVPPATWRRKFFGRHQA